MMGRARGTGVFHFFARVWHVESVGVGGNTIVYFKSAITVCFFFFSGGLIKMYKNQGIKI